MNKYSLFDELSEEEKEEFYRMAEPETHCYSKGELIIHFKDKKNITGIMNSGVACLINIGLDGEENILDYYMQNHIFGTDFSLNSHANLYYIKAKTSCSVNIYQYKKFLTAVAESRQSKILLKNLLNCTVNRQYLQIDILSQKSIRNKLLTYLTYLCEENHTKTVVLPFSLTDLADYLSVDRSAMMREIKKMNTEKIILSQNKTITLLI